MRCPCQIVIFTDSQVIHLIAQTGAEDEDEELKRALAMSMQVLVKFDQQKPGALWSPVVVRSLDEVAAGP